MKMKKRFFIIAASLVLASTLAGCSSAAQGGQTQDLISLDDAKNAALSASQIDTAGASFSTAELSEKNGIPYYQLDFTADGLESVSYTHLDVYKRQIQHIRQR